jgi:hypothetical protein
VLKKSLYFERSLSLRGAAFSIPMSELGQKRRFGDISVTSVLPLKADIRRMVRHVRKVPKADKLTSQFDQSPCLLFHATPPSWAIALRPDERSRQPIRAQRLQL